MGRHLRGLVAAALVGGSLGAVSAAMTATSALAACGQRTVGLTGLSAPRGVATDASGDIFVVNKNSRQVVKFTPGGAQSTLGFTFATTNLAQPVAVAVDNSGDVFVVDNANNQVLELPAAGNQTTLGFTGLKAPTGVAVDGSGNVFVVDQGNLRVVELPAGGGSQTTLPFDFAAGHAVAVAVDAKDDVFVVDDVNNQVLELRGGSVITLGFTLLSQPTGVAVDSAGDVFVADLGAKQVVELSTAGVQTVLPFTFDPAGLPIAVAVDSTGNVFVTDPVTNVVLELVPCVTSSITTVSASPNPSAFSQPVVFTATVGTVPTGGVATGQVTFKDGSATLGVANLVDGKASLSVTSLSVGSHNVTATYSGDFNVNSSAGSMVQNVTKAPTKLTPTPAHGLLFITYSAVLTRVLDGAPLAGKTVNFSISGHRICSGTTHADGVASCTALGLNLGSGGNTATFAGDANYSASTANARF